MTLLVTFSLGAALAGDSDMTVPEAAADLGKGFRVHLEQEFDASAEDVWKVFAHEYVAIDEWATVVEASREMNEEDQPDGVVADDDAPVVGRVVTTGFGEVTETLVMFDDEGMTFTFRAGGLPKRLLAYSQNTHQVHDLGNGRSKITFDIYMVPKGMARLMKGMVKKRFKKGLGHHLEEARDYIETGAISDEKREQLASN